MGLTISFKRGEKRDRHGIGPNTIVLNDCKGLLTRSGGAKEGGGKRL